MAEPAQTYFTRTPGQPVDVVYRNYRGETRRRRVMPVGAPWHGTTTFHPSGQQWFLPVLDLEPRERDSQVARDFALCDVLAWGKDACDAWEATQAALVAAAGGA